MESKVKESMPQISDDTPGMMTTTSNVATDDAAWQEYVDVVIEFIRDLPDELGEFFTSNKKFLTNLGLILLASIVVYVTFSVLDAINSLPLVSSILELIGLGYSGWFIFRYLINKSSRDELVSEFNSLKAQLLGEK